MIKECPYCEKDISSELYEEWCEKTDNSFFFECPFCNHPLQIEAASEVIFYIDGN